VPDSGESGRIPTKMTGFQPKLPESGTELPDSGILAGICQNYWNPAVLAWFFLARSGLYGQIRLDGRNATNLVTRI